MRSNAATDAAPFEIEFHTVLGHRVRTARMGRIGARRKLLVLNGIGASLETVAPFARLFTETEVITLDVPGVGESAPAVMPYRFSMLSHLVARLLDRMGVGEVDVFGVSWGGALAQQFVFDHQQRCRTMVLAATTAGFAMVPGRLDVMSKLASPRRYADPAYMIQVGPDLYGGLLRTNQEHLHQHAAAMRGGSRRGYLHQLLAGMGWTSWHWLPQIKLPVLVLMGDDDPIVPLANGDILVNRLPNAELRVVPCGHLFLLTLPELSAELVEDFIGAHGPFR